MSRLSLLVDLGDAFTKALAAGDVRRERVRFPSVVASRLLRGGSEMTALLLDPGSAVPRMCEVDPTEFPRTRSYAKGAAFVRHVQRTPAVEGARFAGRIAASYGADRRLLGHAPGLDAVDALIHKAVILCAPDGDCEADVTLVVDTGPKAEAAAHYARSSPRAYHVELRSYYRRPPRRLRLEVRARIVDAPACAAAVLPDWLSPARLESVLLVDIGYLRTKLSILSVNGCEHQEVLDSLGTFDMIRRVLRDGEATGLLEDEFAVIDALERTRHGRIEIAGRRFSVEKPLSSARRALEEEVARAAGRTLVAHYQRSGRTCRGVAVFGGGGLWLGEGVRARLDAAGLGIAAVWLCSEPSFFLLSGALAHARASPGLSAGTA